MSDYNDIKDNEIRIIGNAGQSAKPPHKPLWQRWWLWTIIAVVLVFAVILFSVIKGGNGSKQIETEEVVVESAPIAPTVVKTEPATVIIRDTIVNDVPLRIHTPVNAVPELCLGLPDTTDASLILAHQAADIRADNQQIVGAFVLKGELQARGIAKKGFCAIIDGKIQLGMAESTPLFEDAINKDGYFFRQYPLVNLGSVIENKPKGKALRHALCELDGRIVTVSSLDKESFHDFAQALADLGVKNAVYLVGKQAYGFCRSDAGFRSWGDNSDKLLKLPSVNFIVWKAR